MAAKEGDKVSVHYTGQLEDGSVFDSSRERDPMTFQLGAGRVVPGFERAVLGLEIGESVTRTIPCQEAYGERNEEDPVSVARNQFPMESSSLLDRVSGCKPTTSKRWSSGSPRSPRTT